MPSRRITIAWIASLALVASQAFAQPRPQPRPIGPTTPVIRPDLRLPTGTLELQLVPRTFTTTCPDTAYVADVVAIDHPMVFNRIGAQNVNWMMYALRHDVIDISDPASPYPFNYTAKGEERFQAARSRTQSRSIALRPDLRPRPLVLRVPAGSYLKVRLTNLLHVRPVVSPSDDPANPFKVPDPLPGIDHPTERAADAATDAVTREIYYIDDQVHSRRVGFHPQGLELTTNIQSDSSAVGANADSLVSPNDTREYCFYAPEEGGHLVTNDGAVFGGDGTSGDTGVGLFGSVAVQPVKSRMYRGQVTEEEMRLSTRGTTAGGQPIVDYEATYPEDCATNGIWCREGKNGQPILNIVQGRRIMHGDTNAIVAGPNKDGSFPKETYPLERDRGQRNPTVPNRLEPFREFVSIYHDENAATQAFPYFFEHPELGHTLHGVRDAFMINYGSGGIGSEIIANRLQAGPMNDCVDCAYEEFFLSSFAVGDPAMLVDKPVNLGLGRCQPEFIAVDANGNLNPAYAAERTKFCAFDASGKAPAWRDVTDRAGNKRWVSTQAYYPHDPGNVHHSYIGDFVKFRNLHAGKEQHIFHLHNHQWLFNPNDDNSNYIDAQGVGPGSGYTYEIAFGGSGNRNKTVGDAIFHCHFYPHFAQGMWYMWRNHDVMETGTTLAASETGTGFHETPYALKDGLPAKGARALPDGELVAGAPIPAVVPLPGKALPPMPEKVQVTPRAAGIGSKAELAAPFDEGKTRNPGFPFWIAGVTEHAGVDASIGHRPTTPPLDMDTVAGGFDGGLPRHALAGYTEGAKDEAVLDRLSAAKEIHEAKPIYFQEQGTPLERVAMAFHAQRNHATVKYDMAGNVSAANFVVNGAKPVPGSPYNDPCIDDRGQPLLTGGDGLFFGGGLAGSANEWIRATSALPGGIEYGGDKPRIYMGANIQLDVVFNKLGYHYPQQRILALWQDVGPTLSKKDPKAPEPLVLRMNTFDCARYLHTNLVPLKFYGDDYQITTPTDVIGQHIHLPKWDLTSGDGSANGWNYEDATFAPGAVRERIYAINAWNAKEAAAGRPTVPNPYNGSGDPLIPLAHPYFGTPNAEFPTLTDHQRVDCVELWKSIGDLHKFEHEHGFPGECDWLGARTTIQRWFSDPIVNTGGVHRGLGITFTHDHLGPSTHQQIGLYATMLTEPPGSVWWHNEPDALGNRTPLFTRTDGGPTTWQAVITGKDGKPIDVDGDGADDAHREFFLQFGDFQHAYHKGVYVGVSAEGKPYTVDPSAKATTETFRKAINPSLRKPSSPNLPDIAEYSYVCPGGKDAPRLPGAVYSATAAPKRPCPEAISADDVGMMVVNYRNEPVAARVYDPDRNAPDGKRGMQGAGFGSDMSFALQTRTDRRCKRMNFADGNFPAGSPLDANPGVCGNDGGENTPYDVQSGALAGDPFTPIMRAYAGDLIKVKVQAGSHEHEHNGSVNALAWLQAGSGFGQAPNSGWRNAQNTGLSEQFTFAARITDYHTRNHQNDRMYALDASQDGMWNGVWGVLRSLNRRDRTRDKLVTLPSNPRPTLLAPTLSPTPFQGGVPLNDCPAGAPVRFYKVTAVLANQALPNPLGAYIDQPKPAAGFSSYSYVDPNGGTLIYNPRRTAIQIDVYDGSTKVRTDSFGAGPLHDPTAILFVRSEDLDANGRLIATPTVVGGQSYYRPLEPLVLRASAGECVRVVLENRLPRLPTRMPDLDGYTMLTGMIPRSEGGAGQDMTAFNNNLIRPSNWIGLHPQLVHYDVQSYDGNNVGVNRRSTIGPGRSMTYQWYAGVVQTVGSAETCPVDDPSQLNPKLDLLNAIGAKPYQRPLSEVYDETAFNDTALRLISDSYSKGGEPTPEEQKVVSDLIAATRNYQERAFPGGGGGCFEDPNAGVADLGKAIDGNAVIDDAEPLPSDAMYSRTARLASRVQCAAALNEEYNRVLVANSAQMQTIRTQRQRQQLAASRLTTRRTATQTVQAVPPDATLSQRLAASFQYDVAGVDDAPDQAAAYRWLDGEYARLDADSIRLIRLHSSAQIKPGCRYVDVEFGGTNLTPPDRIKQGQKAAVGAMVIEPWKARWSEYYDDRTVDRQAGINTPDRRATRATATVRYPSHAANGTVSNKSMRDLVVVHQKGLNFRYGNKPFTDPYEDFPLLPGVFRGNAVANLAAEREGADFLREPWWGTAPEDAHDSGHMAINYGSEPMWFRFGLPPDAAFGKEGLGGATNAWQAFADGCCSNGGTATSATPNVGHPYVPVMTTSAGTETRLRMLMPTGVGRATTFTLHGHVWQRDPYLAEEVDANGIPVGSRPAEWGIASHCIGDNGLGMYLGAQESLSPMAHFDVVLARAGGIDGVAGDYLWRDIGGFGITSGLWGIMRVQPSLARAGLLPARCHP